MSLVQIYRIQGEILRVPKDQVPIIEIDLEEDRRILQVEEFRVQGIDGPYSARYENRSTYDWRWTALVEWRMKPLD